MDSSEVGGLEKSLADQIRAQLSKQGMDQKTLAEMIGIERATLNRYLMGHRSMNVPTVARIAEALKIDASVLLAPMTEPVNDAGETR